jgi:hypothetical protein
MYHSRHRALIGRRTAAPALLCAALTSAVTLLFLTKNLGVFASELAYCREMEFIGIVTGNANARAGHRRSPPTSGKMDQRIQFNIGEVSRQVTQIDSVDPTADAPTCLGLRRSIAVECRPRHSY